jgi:flagellar motor switch protein FliN/FliY
MSELDKTMQGEFFARWGNAIASVLSQIAGATWTAGAENVDGTASGERVTLDFTAAKSLAGHVRLRLARADAAKLVAIFTGETASEEWNADQQEALEELARQFAGQLATSLKPDLGEVEFRLEAAEGFSAADSASPILLHGPQGEAVGFEFEIDQQLKTAFSPEPAPAVVAQMPSASNNLDLLMDVELAVTLRFGQRQMMLQDILDLQSGSVIELDREIQEPVDLLLDGRVIARGGVVVVDGNYGLRVTEVGGMAMAGA